MHAASVHPEPGSNSRMFVSKIPFRELQISIRAWLLFTFCLSSISLRIVEFRSHTIHESLHVQCLYFPLVVQFSMTDLVLCFLRSLIIIAQRNPLVNPFFEKISNFFILFFGRKKRVERRKMDVCRGDCKTKLMVCRGDHWSPAMNDNYPTNGRSMIAPTGLCVAVLPH